MIKNIPKDTFSLEETANILHICTKTVVRENIGEKRGGQWAIQKKHIISYLENRPG